MIKWIHLIAKSSFVLMVSFFLEVGYCERVSINCTLRLDVQSRYSGSSSSVEELRIEVSDDNDKLLIYSKSIVFDISINNYRRTSTRSIENRSDHNIWSITRIDDVGKGVQFKSINIDRNLGKFRYEESLSIDGRIIYLSRAFGDCIGVEEKLRRF